jgi:ectoine hydroxylase-related dioxygenase (phytanoyl-CoA dioxygenase family)
MFDEKAKENLKYQIKKNGYVVIKEFLSQEEVQIYRKSISNLSRRESLSISGLNYFSIQKRIINTLKIFLGEKIYYPFLSKPVNEIYQSQAGKSFMHNDVHIGVDDFCFEKKTNIYNTGLYLQSHNKLDGGLKVRPKSHKKICLEDHNFLMKLKKVLNFLLKKPKNISFSQIIRTLLPYKSINISIDAGDLIIWDIRLHHSGNAKKLKFFPNISLSTYLENLIPSVFTNLNKEERYAIFTVYIGNSEYKDKYIESQINEKHISLWRDSKTNINLALEIMKKNGVLPVDQILKYYES